MTILISCLILHVDFTKAPISKLKSDSRADSFFLLHKLSLCYKVQEVLSILSEPLLGKTAYVYSNFVKKIDMLLRTYV